MLVKCPYCKIESPIEQWYFKVDRPLFIKQKNQIEGIKNIEYNFDYTVCPVCLRKISVDLSSYINSNLVNLEDIKTQIENYFTIAEDMGCYCETCNCWNYFYDFLLIGKDKLGNKKSVEVEDVFMSLTKSESFLLEKVRCIHCGNEISVEPFEIKFPLDDRSLSEIFNILNKKTKEILKGGKNGY